MQTQRALEREKRKKIWVARLNHLWNKLTALAWVVGALVCLHYSNFFETILHSTKVNPLFGSVALVSFSIFASILLYSAFVLPACVEVEVAAPNLIHMAAAVGFFSFLTTLIAVWPVYGWYTPVYLIVMLGGYIFLGTFLPKGMLGNVLFVLVFVLAANYRAPSPDEEVNEAVI
mmetsp:Transcript_34669/g.60966  ORF Transcript_34669/g.60966 Transcript_34669/m.60966 type:complete len:174 (-) Transcript_34669:3110-3631(-)